MPDWDIVPGTKINRVALHERFGGSVRGGISPSKKSDNVLIFTSSEGSAYGYSDAWHPDGAFHYTGEGQVGDQEYVRGNRALGDHEAEGRAVRLFDGSGGDVTYVGQFRVDETERYYVTDAPDRNGEIRKVIIFRLVPVGSVVGASIRKTEETRQPPADMPSIELVAPENAEVEHFTTGGVAPGVAERREAELVRRYRHYRASNGLPAVVRLKIKPPGEVQPLFSDLYVQEDNLLIESKGTTTREAVRMAIGQLFDYRRFVRQPCRLAALFPERPRFDLIELLATNNIEIIVPGNGGTFESIRSPGGAQ